MINVQETATLFPKFKKKLNIFKKNNLSQFLKGGVEFNYFACLTVFTFNQSVIYKITYYGIIGSRRAMDLNNCQGEEIRNYKTFRKCLIIYKESFIGGILFLI